MRVTDELVERLGYALDACEFTTPYADVPSMLRRILEDVLLHVPEPLPALSGPAGVGKYVDATQRCYELEALLAELEEKLDATKHERQCQHDRPEDAVNTVEDIMRRHGVMEVRFWREGTSFDAITGEGFDVTITLRNARGVLSGLTLAAALARIPSSSTIGSKETP
jgi:hypothetical protein